MSKMRVAKLLSPAEVKAKRFGSNGEFVIQRDGTIVCGEYKQRFFNVYDETGGLSFRTASYHVANGNEVIETIA